ncbi:hypothetical protein Dimus_029509, partial [Dionaea muscipula]
MGDGGVVSEEVMMLLAAGEALRPQPGDGAAAIYRSPMVPMPKRVVGNDPGMLPMAAEGSCVGGETPGRAKQLLPHAPMAMDVATGMGVGADAISRGCCRVEEGPIGDGKAQTSMRV